MPTLWSSGKVSLLLASVTLITACSSLPPRNSSEVQTDTRMELAVAHALANDPELYSRHIEVSVYLGVVTLSGFVFEAKDPGKAVADAAQVPGVRSVSDQIDLQIGGVARAQ